MQIIDEIKELGVEAVVSKYSLIYKDFGHKFLLKYSQINSIAFKSNEAVRECRGIVISEDLRVLSLPFVRFFNYNEPEADVLDMNSIECFKKEDGSLIAIYYDDYIGDFCVQTSGSADAMTSVGIFDLTFRELFLKTSNIDFENLNKNYNYVFELCTVENKVVEHHAEPYAVLLTVRDLKNLDDGKYGEFDYDEVKRMGDELNVRVVEKYDFKNIHDVLNNIELLAPTREGYVIKDAFFKRIKIKNPKYVLLHHAKSAFSKKSLVEIIIENETDEFLSYFPEYSAIICKTKALYNRLVNEMYMAFFEAMQVYGKEKSRKDFAMFLNNEKKHLSLFHQCFYKNIERNEIDVKAELKQLKDKNPNVFIKYFNL